MKVKVKVNEWMDDFDRFPSPRIMDYVWDNEI